MNGGGRQSVPLRPGDAEAARDFLDEDKENLPPAMPLPRPHGGLNGQTLASIPQHPPETVQPRRQPRNPPQPQERNWGRERERRWLTSRPGPLRPIVRRPDFDFEIGEAAHQLEGLDMPNENASDENAPAATFEVRDHQDQHAVNGIVNSNAVNGNGEVASHLRGPFERLAIEEHQWMSPLRPRPRPRPGTRPLPPIPTMFSRPTQRQPHYVQPMTYVQALHMRNGRPRRRGPSLPRRPTPIEGQWDRVRLHSLLRQEVRPEDCVDDNAEDWEDVPWSSSSSSTYCEE